MTIQTTQEEKQQLKKAKRSVIDKEGTTNSVVWSYVSNLSKMKSNIHLSLEQRH